MKKIKEITVFILFLYWGMERKNVKKFASFSFRELDIIPYSGFIAGAFLSLMLMIIITAVDGFEQDPKLLLLGLTPVFALFSNHMPSPEYGCSSADAVRRDLRELLIQKSKKIKELQ